MYFDYSHITLLNNHPQLKDFTKITSGKNFTPIYGKLAFNLCYTFSSLLTLVPTVRYRKDVKQKKLNVL